MNPCQSPDQRAPRSLRLASAAGVLLLGACAAEPTPTPPEGGPRAAAPREAIPIRTARVEEVDAPLAIRAVGFVAAKEEQRLAFKVGGVLERVRVEEGDAVKEGQVLATLKLSEIDAQVRAAENAFEKAARDLERVERLESARVATLEQRQDAKTGYEVAKSQLEIARFNRRFAAISAPSSGRVAKRLANAGEMVAPGAPILVLLATGQGWMIRVAVPDRDFVRIRSGDRASFVVDALPGRTFSAVVTELASAPHPVTGTYDVELRIDGEPDGLVVGLFAKGTIQPSASTRLAYIPAESIVEAEGSRAAVWALSEDRGSVRRVEVVTARFERDRIGVSAGLEGVREVVTAGAPFLREQVAFRIVESGEGGDR